MKKLIIICLLFICYDATSQVRQSEQTAKSLLNQWQIEKIKSLEKEVDGLTKLDQLTRQLVNLEKKNDELAKENEILKQKLTLIHIAYGLQQNVLANKKAQKKAPEDLIIVQTVFDY